MLNWQKYNSIDSVKKEGIMTNKDMVSGFGTGFLVGTITGIVLGVLYAPHRGAETRELIKKKAGGAKEKAEEIIEKAKEEAQKIVEKAKEKSTERQEEGEKKGE
jgi:gas vesicle protein